MQHLFVSYEIAKQLKDKGFDELCFKIYHIETKSIDSIHIGVDTICNSELEDHPYGEGYIGAPLNQQATDWLENKYGFFFERMYENINKEEVFMLWRNGDIERNHTHKSLEQMIQEALNLI